MRTTRRSTATARSRRSTRSSATAWSGSVRREPLRRRERPLHPRAGHERHEHRRFPTRPEGRERVGVHARCRSSAPCRRSSPRRRPRSGRTSAARRRTRRTSHATPGDLPDPTSAASLPGDSQLTPEIGGAAPRRSRRRLERAERLNRSGNRKRERKGADLLERDAWPALDGAYCARPLPRGGEGAMMTAIRKSLRDFIAVIALIVIAARHQLRDPPAAAAADPDPGGEAVRAQGRVRDRAGGRRRAGPDAACGRRAIGDVSKVELEDGRAVVTFDVDREYLPIYKDATILMRPRTGLKDMFFSLDPGTRTRRRVRGGRHRRRWRTRRPT